MPSKSPGSLLVRLAQALDEAGFRYAVTGGQALLVHSRPRVTLDVDITVACPLEDLARLVEALAAAGISPLPDDPLAFARRHYVIPCLDSTTGLRVDVTIGLTPYETEALARAVTVPVMGYPVRYLAPEDLLVHKLVAWRPQDRVDAQELLRAQPHMDLTYVRRWLREFEKALGRPLRARLNRLLRDIPST
ncbi:hypothetical protein HRbin24_02151 [bacterium HR24]|nr:hypothetical protein HRbin24_02151 [bacterium HR24]